jgi:alpha-glucosidase
MDLKARRQSNPYARIATISVRSVNESWHPRATHTENTRSSFHATGSVRVFGRLDLQRRYRLHPYLYTLAREAAETGLPIARPLFFADPADTSLRAADHAFLLGDDLLVVANVAPDRTVAALPPLPRGRWREVGVVDGDLADPDLPRLFLREGAALPLGPIVQWSDEKPLDAIELLVNPDAEGRATGVLYEDAGDGVGYQNREYRLTRFSYAGGRAQAEVVDGVWSAGEWRLEAKLVK